MIGREAAKVIGLHHPLTSSRAVAVEKILSLSLFLFLNVSLFTCFMYPDANTQVQNFTIPAHR